MFVKIVRLTLDADRINQVINNVCIEFKYRFVSSHLRIANEIRKYIRKNCVNLKPFSTKRSDKKTEKKNERKENFFIRCVLWLMVAGVVANTCLFVFRTVSLSFIFHLVFFCFVLGSLRFECVIYIYFFLRSCFSLIRWNFSVKLYMPSWQPPFN